MGETNTELKLKELEAQESFLEDESKLISGVVEKFGFERKDEKKDEKGILEFTKKDNIAGTEMKLSVGFSHIGEDEETIALDLSEEGKHLGRKEVALAGWVETPEAVSSAVEQEREKREREVIFTKTGELGKFRHQIMENIGNQKRAKMSASEDLDEELRALEDMWDKEEAGRLIRKSDEQIKKEIGKALYELMERKEELVSST